MNFRVRVRVRDTAPVAHGVRQALQAVAPLAGDLAKLRVRFRVRVRVRVTARARARANPTLAGLGLGPT